MNISRNEFDHKYQEIIQYIEECDFVSIDLEFTGLHLTQPASFLGHDVMYYFHRVAAQHFIPIQFGLCIVSKEENNQTENQNHFNKQQQQQQKTKIKESSTLNSSSPSLSKQTKWVFRPYNFYIFPRTRKDNHMNFKTSVFTSVTSSPVFSMSSEALEFFDQIQGGFDLNRWVREGIGYIRRDEEEERIRLLEEWETELEDKIHQRSVSKRRHNNSHSQNKRLKKDIDISKLKPKDHQFLSSICSKIDNWQENREKQRHKNDSEPLTIDVSNPFKRRLVYQAIRAKYSHLYVESVIDDYDNSIIYIFPISEPSLESESYDKINLAYDELEQNVGFRKIIDTIVDNKTIVVGHNCFFDMIHIYETFLEPLPPTFDEFRSKLHRYFPHIFDTKVIAEEFENRIMNQLKVERSNLKHLFDAIQSLNQTENNNNNTNNNNNLNHSNNNNLNNNHSNNIKPLLPNIYMPNQFSEYENNEFHHEAGYDAYMTAFLFVFECTQLRQNSSFDLEYSLRGPHPIPHFNLILGNTSNTLSETEDIDLKRIVNHIRVSNASPSIVRTSCLTPQFITKRKFKHINTDENIHHSSESDQPIRINEENVLYISNLPFNWRLKDIIGLFRPHYIQVKWINQNSAYVILDEKRTKQHHPSVSSSADHACHNSDNTTAACLNNETDQNDQSRSKLSTSEIHLANDSTQINEPNSPLGDENGLFCIKEESSIANQPLFDIDAVIQKALQRSHGRISIKKEKQLILDLLKQLPENKFRTINNKYAQEIPSLRRLFTPIEEEEEEEYYENHNNNDNNDNDGHNFKEKNEMENEFDDKHKKNQEEEIKTDLEQKSSPINNDINSNQSFKSKNPNSFWDGL